jgi:hypothetical protein
MSSSSQRRAFAALCACSSHVHLFLFAALSLSLSLSRAREQKRRRRRRSRVTHCLPAAILLPGTVEGRKVPTYLPTNLPLSHIPTSYPAVFFLKENFVCSQSGDRARQDLAKFWLSTKNEVKIV